MKPLLLLLLSFLASGATRVEVAATTSDYPMLEPFGVAFDASHWYIVEHKGERILRLQKGKPVAVFAGTGEVGNSGDGGAATSAKMFDPHGIVLTRDASLMYVADTRNHQVRKIDMRAATIMTIAGTGQPGFSGDGGPARSATFNGTFGIALSPDDRVLYVADLGNRRVRKIDLASGIITTAAGNGANAIPADGAVAAESPLQDPRAVTVDSKNNLYILERNGNALRLVDPQGRIRTVIAPGKITPDMKGPKHLCVDRDDSVIIADAENHLIRRYDPKSGETKTIAGTGTKGTHIDASNPLKSELNRPHGVFVNRKGELYISDSYNNRIIKVSGR